MTRLQDNPEMIGKVRELMNQGFGVSEVSEKINISYPSVALIARSNGIKYINKKRAFTSKHDWSAIAADYEAGVQTRDIMKKYEVLRSRIYKYMHEKGINRPEDFKILRVDDRTKQPKKRLRKNKHDWQAIALDFEDGVQVDDICEKHKIGEQYLSCKMTDLGVTRPEGYKRKQVNPPRKNQVIIDNIKFLAAENLTIKSIAKVIGFTLTQDQLPDYPLDYAAIENICEKHKITTKG